MQGLKPRRKREKPGIPPSSEDRVGQGLLDNTGLCCDESGRPEGTRLPQGNICPFHAEGMHCLKEKRESETLCPAAQSNMGHMEMDFSSYSIAHDLRFPLLVAGLSQELQRRLGDLLRPGNYWQTNWMSRSPDCRGVMVLVFTWPGGN
jgi:hypothetical protein